MDMRYAGRGGGGGCVARYVGHGLYDISMVDRMMLKFRPIAPKPVASGSGSGDSAMENGCKSGGGKRRYVRVKGNNRNKDNKKRKVSASSFQPREAVSSGGDAVVTLSLMPETPDRKENSPAVSSSSENLDVLPVKVSCPIWLSFKNNNQTLRDHHVRITPAERRQTVSYVTVEWMAETCVDKVWVGWMEMESDTCPGFISDGQDRVVWMNKAYREMVGGEETVVVLVRKDGSRAVVGYPAAFTCNVRVTCWSGTSSSTLTVPCDAWRMEGGCGGYAWRLDVKAALSLGR